MSEQSGTTTAIVDGVRTYGEGEGNSAAGFDSEQVRGVLASLTRISLEETPLETQLEEILDHIFSIPWLSLETKGAIFLVDGEEHVLTMKAQRNLSPTLLEKCARVPFGRCLCGRAAAWAGVEHATCVDHRHEVTYDGMPPHGHYVVPIVLQGKCMGVINLYLAEGHLRDAGEEEFLRTVADILAGIIAHKRTQRELETTLMALRRTLGTTVEAMGATLETRDPYTAGHQRRVTELARAIGQKMGLDPESLEAMCTAATVHDIGKIAIPAEILSKPTGLTDTEMEMIKIHPKVGYDILRHIEFKQPIARMVLQHHERLDGSGYPAGLRGQDILTESRILAVADVVEAMATHRPYRPSRGLECALAEISVNNRRAYDTTAADTCVKLFRQEGFEFKA